MVSAYFRTRMAAVRYNSLNNSEYMLIQHNYRPNFNLKEKSTLWRGVVVSHI